MLNNITIGTYLPLNSIIHKLSPLSKIISLIFFLVGVFLINDFTLYLISTIIVLIIVKLAKLSIIRLLKSLKILLFMFIFLIVINSLLIQSGDKLFTILNISIYSDAFLNTFKVFLRLSLMIFLSSVLTLTTKPLDLTIGIEQLLKPLKKINFPVHEVAMMISIALRFIPTLVEETNKIMIAQSSRGVDFQAKKLSDKIKAVVSLLVPLFVSSFKRADDLANAMEARGYNPSATRTRFNQHDWYLKDSIALVISILFMVGVLVWNINI